MSDTTSLPTTDRIRLDWVIVGVVVAVCVGIFLYVMAGRQYALRESASGFDGLDRWLNSQSHITQSFTGGWPLDRSTVGLLVQPVYDTRLDTDRNAARTKEELLLQADEFDQETEVIRDKVQSVPSLVILPKWRSGMRLTGFGHPFLMSPRAEIQTILHQIAGTDVGPMALARRPFSDYALAADPQLKARIYAAQTFAGRGCDPIVGRAGEMLLGACPLPGSEDGQKVYILSDPDLLNNHGLTLGDNAWIAAQVLPEIAGDQRIIIDYSDQNWLTAPELVEARERTWDDLKRLFEPPFRALWIGAGLLLALAIWRGGVRSGPVIDIAPTLGTGKRMANRARARLMRMTDQDGAMLSDYVDTRLRARAAAVFGSTYKTMGTPEEAYLKYVRARKPDLAARLDALIQTIRALPPHLAAADAISHIDQFEMILEHLADES